MRRRRCSGARSIPTPGRFYPPCPLPDPTATRPPVAIVGGAAAPVDPPARCRFYERMPPLPTTCAGTTTILPWKTRGPGRWQPATRCSPLCHPSDAIPLAATASCYLMRPDTSRNSQRPVEASRRGRVTSIKSHTRNMSLGGLTHSKPSQFQRSTRKSAAE